MFATLVPRKSHTARELVGADYMLSAAFIIHRTSVTCERPACNLFMIFDPPVGEYTIPAVFPVEIRADV